MCSNSSMSDEIAVLTPGNSWLLNIGISSGVYTGGVSRLTRADTCGVLAWFESRP
jgi:hypothetical protein